MEDTKKGTDILSKEADRARERVRDIAENALEKGRETWKGLKERGDEVVDDAREQGQEAWDEAEKFVKKYPGKAVGLSLLVGTVLGVVIAAASRRD